MVRSYVFAVHPAQPFNGPDGRGRRWWLFSVGTPRKRVMVCSDQWMPIVTQELNWVARGRS